MTTTFLVGSWGVVLDLLGAMQRHPFVTIITRYAKYLGGKAAIFRFRGNEALQVLIESRTNWIAFQSRIKAQYPRDC